MAKQISAARPATKQSYYLSAWIVRDAEAAKFDAADVCALTGVSSQTLQNWADRGLVAPERLRNGKGDAQRYSKVDLCSIKLAIALISLGIEASAALETAESLVIIVAKRLGDGVRVSDSELVRMIGAVVTDALGRTHVALLKNTGYEIHVDEANPQNHESIRACEPQIACKLLHWQPGLRGRSAR